VDAAGNENGSRQHGRAVGQREPEGITSDVDIGDGRPTLLDAVTVELSPTELEQIERRSAISREKP
jgi:hypothetical protein